MMRVSRIVLAGFVSLSCALPACADERTKPAVPATTTAAAATSAKKESKMTKTPSGLEYEDTVVGTGALPKPAQKCVMHYTGWLYENGAKGKKFDSSLDRGQPFEFQIGLGQVIKGWDEGVATMKVGGKRTLVIPPAIGYGTRGAGGVIPPNATLLFEVELLGVK
ncbi:MAG: FKBP-type peptidyl-prolyl cis-trans isomerase [Acidobacteriota bacterium]